jgi:hypothetical protein
VEKSAEQGNRITGEAGKSVDDERVAEGGAADKAANLAR